MQPFDPLRNFGETFSVAWAGLTQQEGQQLTILKVLAVTTAIMVLSGPTAFAADLISVPTSTPVEVPVYDDIALNWSGFYAGIYGGLQNSSAGGGQYGVGLDVGVNATFDFYLLAQK